jgi:flavin-dependent dehydrogenase
MSIQPESDVVVIGGGPAGSTVSTLIAQRGYRVQLFERERFPRFHIGESLIPETYWVLKRLGMLDKMRRSRFVKKYSVQFVNAAGKLSAPFYFWDNKPHECSQTWQVVRSEFDAMMLQNAREHGVDAHEGVRVVDVRFEPAAGGAAAGGGPGRASGVTVQFDGGERREVRARVVVDASGQNGLLMNRLGLRLWDPVLNKGAIWTYWKGAYRDTGRDEGATMVLQTANRKGWFWYIPLHDDRVSVGIVAPFDYLFKNRGDREQTYRQEVERCPAVAERIAGATRLTGYFATKDYSYRSRQVAGDGWVLVGDAFGFLDRSTPRACCWRCGRASRPPTPSPRASSRTTCRRRSSASGGRASMRGSTGCGAWSVSTTTASASGSSCAPSRTCAARSPTC